MSMNGFDELREAYKAAGFNARFGFGEKPAVLVVDFQKGFTREEFPMGYDYSKEIEATCKVLDLARSKDLPVVFVGESYQRNLKDAGIWHKKVNLTSMMMGDPSTELDDRLGFRPESETFLIKKGASAFFGTNLISVLVPERVDTLIVTGCTTSGCFRASVIDACQYGFRVIVPKEAVGDRADLPHDANLFDMDFKYADVMPLEEVLEALEKY